MARQYKQSEAGVAEHPWINKADTKFNSDGLYHTGIIYAGEKAETIRKELDVLCEEALAEHIKDMKPAEARKWSCHYPYKVEEDDDTGAPTGRIIVQYKQNAVIFMEDGTKKPIEISVRDAKNKPTPTPIYSGDTIKVMYAPRATVATSNKTVGIRLDFCMAQIIKKAKRTGGNSGFDTVDDGYVDDRGTEDSKPSDDATDY